MTNDKIILAEFYSFFDNPKLYTFNMENGKVNLAASETLYDGFFSIEECIFGTRKITVAIFIDNRKPFLYFDGNLFEIDDSFSIKRYSFLIYTLITVRKSKKKSPLRCWQRARDIDPFYMNDFFTYLVFILKTDFEGYIDSWPERIEGLQK